MDEAKNGSAGKPVNMTHSSPALQVPVMEEGVPRAGARVRQTVPAYKDTAVYHSLYLPTDWEEGKQYPVIVEYTGNYFPPSGSTGEVKDAALGYGLSAGSDFIWVVMPYIAHDGASNQLTWWGDEQATIDYCQVTIESICDNYGGDRSRIILCGFSRGAIGVNYLGLHDDEIAKLWRGFITHDHYDGVREWEHTYWGSPLDTYRENAKKRLSRLNGRPVLIMQNKSTEAIKAYMDERISCAQFTFLDVPIEDLFPDIPNESLVHPHTDRWLLYNHEYTDRARAWLQRMIS